MILFVLVVFFLILVFGSFFFLDSFLILWMKFFMLLVEVELCVVSVKYGLVLGLLRINMIVRELLNKLLYWRFV